MLNSLRNILAAILSLEFIIVFSLVFFSFFAADLLFITVLVGIGFWFIRWLDQGFLTLRSPVDFGIALLLLMTLISLWLTSNALLTYYQVLRIWSGVILFYAIVNWTLSQHRLRILVYLLIVASLIFAVLSILGVDWPIDKLPIIPIQIYDYLPRLFPGVFNPNVMAGYLVLLLPFSLSLLLFAWSKIKGWECLFLVFVCVMVTGVLILTQSRGALIAFGAVGTLLVVLRWPRTWIIIPLLAVGALVLVLYIGVDSILNTLSGSVSLGGFTGRFEYWSRAIYIIKDFPLTGVGLGFYLPVVDTMYPFFFYEPASIPHAHNILLQIAVDLGIPGLLAWLSVFLGISFIAWLVYRKGFQIKNMWLAGLGAGFLLSQVALLVHGMFDAVTWGLMRTAPIVWMVWGAAVVCFLISNKNHSTE